MSFSSGWLMLRSACPAHGQNVVPVGHKGGEGKALVEHLGVLGGHGAHLPDGRILFEDHFPVPGGKDLQWVPAPDALGAADLLGDDHPAQFINAADDSGCFHAVFPPCFRFCLQFGCVHSICQPREFIPAMHSVKIPPGAPRFSLPLHCVLGGLLLQ